MALLGSKLDIHSFVTLIDNLTSWKKRLIVMASNYRTNGSNINNPSHVIISRTNLTYTQGWCQDISLIDFIGTIPNNLEFTSSKPLEDKTPLHAAQPFIFDPTWISYVRVKFDLQFKVHLFEGKLIPEIVFQLSDVWMTETD